MLRHLLISLVLILSTTQAALAGISEEDKAQDAAVVLRELATIPEEGIPPRLLEQAYAIAVIPDVLKVGFIFGGRRGEGVMSVRTQDGRWSNPTFITLTGASVGWQIGASSTDLILVFKSRDSVERITQGKITLGADVGIAAGPVGRQATATTDIRFESEA
ncbi:MAG: lipid-binding SYLF domain-containing protein, partial [Nevskiales bacterium]